MIPFISPLNTYVDFAEIAAESQRHDFTSSKNIDNRWLLEQAVRNGEQSPTDIYGRSLDFSRGAGSRRLSSGAVRLGMAPSTVSETITRLEAQLGVPLLHRTTRSMVPTEAGNALATRLSPMWAEVRIALQDAASSQIEIRGMLRLNVRGAVMIDILPPLIDRFLERHPSLGVEIVVTDRLVDIIGAGCDAGIRYDEHLAQDMIAIPIGPRVQSVGYAASQQYLLGRGEPNHPRDLLDHDCIRLRFASGALVEWEFAKDGEVLTIDPAGRLTVGVDAVGAAIGLAASGRGVIGTFANWIEPAIVAGQLKPVLRGWWQPFEGPKLYFARRFMPAPLRAFVDFVRSRRELHDPPMTML